MQSLGSKQSKNWQFEPAENLALASGVMNRALNCTKKGRLSLGLKWICPFLWWFTPTYFCHDLPFVWWKSMRNWHQKHSCWTSKQEHFLKSIIFPISCLKAKPPSKLCPFGHNAVFPGSVFFAGGLTPMPVCIMQPSNHQDITAEHPSCFVFVPKS